MNRWTQKMALAALGLLLALPAAHAEGFLDWLESHSARGAHEAKAPADRAELLTLEPGESEMYPKVSPDGRQLLVVSGKGREALITRRLVENGDPLNVVTEDPHALDSVAWSDDAHVIFLSERAGGLGLWEKPAAGRGVLRRLLQLSGELTQPGRLADGSVVAVRIRTGAHRSKPKSPARMRAMPPFANWDFGRAEPVIVRIFPDGSERELARGVNPAVSPDGKRIAFSMAAGRSRHLFVMDADGGNLVQLTDARSIDVQPAWSPDGKWIVFTSNRARADMRHPSKSNWDIWAVTLDGSRIEQLTKDPARDGAPSVSGGWVYFHSDRKVPPAERKARQVRSARGFHIWRIALP